MQRSNYVLDTNIWISAIISNSFFDLEKIIIEENLKIFICPEMILELEDVLKRSKFKKYLKNTIPFYISEIQKICILEFSETKYNEAPDKDDNYLYDICIETKSILVTGDKLLLTYISNPLVITISRNDFFKLISRL